MQGGLDIAENEKLLLGAMLRRKKMYPPFQKNALIQWLDGICRGQRGDGCESDDALGEGGLPSILLVSRHSLRVDRLSPHGCSTVEEILEMDHSDVSWCRLEVDRKSFADSIFAAEIRRLCAQRLLSDVERELSRAELFVATSLLQLQMRLPSVAQTLRRLANFAASVYGATNQHALDVPFIREFVCALQTAVSLSASDPFLQDDIALLTGANFYATIPETPRNHAELDIWMCSTSPYFSCMRACCTMYCSSLFIESTKPSVFSRLGGSMRLLRRVGPSSLVLTSCQRNRLPLAWDVSCGKTSFSVMFHQTAARCVETISVTMALCRQLLPPEKASHLASIAPSVHAVHEAFHDAFASSQTQSGCHIHSWTLELFSSLARDFPDLALIAIGMPPSQLFCITSASQERS